MLEATILPEFKFILNGEPIFPFEDMDFALIPHVGVPWGTNRGDVLDPQSSTSTLLVGFQFNRFILGFKKVIPNLFNSRGPLSHSSYLGSLWDRLID